MSIVVDLNNPALFFNEEFFQNPYATYRELLKLGDISFVNLYGGMFYMASYDAISKVITDKRVSHDTLQFLEMQFSEEQRSNLSDFFRLNRMWLIHADGRQHMRYRMIISKALALSMKQIPAHITSSVNQLIDQVESKGGMEFIQQFAHNLPSLVITKILGIPEKDLNLVVESSELSSKVFGSTQADYELAMKAQQKLLELDAYLKELLLERMEDQQEDMLSYFLSVDDNGDKLSLDEIAAQCAALLFGGHETTRSMLGNGLLALLKHPEQMEELKQNPSLIKTAVPEMLRYDSPVQFTVRVVIQDIEIFGQRIPAGSPVMFCFGSANHDPAKFSQPVQFDIKRNEARNLSFGMGAHSCSGAQLAVMEAEIAFNILLQRLPNMKWADARPNWQPNAGFRGLKELNITF